MHRGRGVIVSARLHFLMFYLADAFLFALFALALLSLGLGAFAPERSLLEALVLPALAILGALGLLIWLAGSLGFSNGLVWAIIFVAVWLICMVTRRRNVVANARRIWPALRNLSALEKALAFYLLAVWALVFVLNLAPPSGADYDSLVYHLAVPAQYARLGRIEALPFDHHSYFPFTLEMLYGVALQLRGPVFAKLFHWLMLPLGALTLIAFGQRAQTRAGRITGGVPVHLDADDADRSLDRLHRSGVRGICRRRRFVFRGRADAKARA